MNGTQMKLIPRLLQLIPFTRNVGPLRVGPERSQRLLGPILPRWGRRHVPTMSPLYVPMAPFHRTSGDGCRWRPVSFRRIVSSISRWTGRGGNQGDALWVRSVNQHDIVCIINS